ncbi:MAG: SDR family NAD(P)-dependent oxidoreductase [Chloroflexi bacterium]|nr:SDR family NAD(P)-dependent oxidoreductase [Chloroflexota bacterium]
MNLRLDNKVAIVTGAGRGIGEAIAHALADAGARVAVNDINPDRAERVAAAIRQNRGRPSASPPTSRTNFNAPTSSKPPAPNGTNWTFW